MSGSCFLVAPFRSGSALLDLGDATHEAAEDVGACDHTFLIRPHQDHILVDDVVTRMFQLDLEQADNLAKALLGVRHYNWAMAVDEGTKGRGPEQGIAEEGV